MNFRPLLTTALVACLSAAWLTPAVAAPQAASAPVTSPTLSGHTPQGQAVDLTAYRGKVVMLLFWSTDCAVCLNTLPELRRNLAGWRGKDFVVIAVNQDPEQRTLTDYEALLDRLVPPNPQMKIVWRKESLHRDNFGAMPPRELQTVVLDRTGHVFKSVHGRFPPEVWDDVADLLLN
jgi:thiol-disulfide isomerase/thioredoxin